MADETDVTGNVNYTLTAKELRAGKYKSAEFVEDSSDLEDLPENNLPRVSPETKCLKGKIKSKEVSYNVLFQLTYWIHSFGTKPRASLKSPLKKRQKTVAHDNEDTVSGHALTNSESKTKDSDSDNQPVSILDDDSKPRTSGDKSRMKKINSSKSKGEVSDKHDAMIKKLKSLVHACGVRKPWVKEFKDMPKPAQQIKKLREILTELGMTGRMSMEQAKRIKAERELAQELEDVKSFEQSMLKSSRGRIAESSLRPSLKQTHSEDEDSENDVDLKHRRRKIPPSRSIDAFIGSESDDD
ncbi:hypothetical protein C0992_005300 [Termitomyces sp. T32_za158]|nr:hypothetical protein C0992_005300 [Termitomyces sp. T32_za158]